jgi:hypothetical protein
MSYYLCRRCFYKTNQKSDIRRHLNRQKKCEKNVQSLFISDEKLNELSLIKIKSENLKSENSAHKCTQNKDFSTITAHKIENISNDDFVKIEHINIDDISNNNNNNDDNNFIIEELNKINIVTMLSEKDDLKLSCPTCNKYFTRASSLKRHQKMYCSKICVENNTTLNNTTNNMTTNNILNINLNIDNKITKITPFDEDWDVSKIDNQTKQALLMSSIKFTKTMEKILENDANMNVLIEKEKNSGIVYKNDNEQFKEMELTEIMDKSMKKLYKHLKQFYDEIKDDNEYNICNQYLDNEKIMIDNKYEEYKKNHDTQKIVQDHLISLYDKNKEKTLSNYKNIIENDRIQDENKFIGF